MGSKMMSMASEKVLASSILVSLCVRLKVWTGGSGVISGYLKVDLNDETMVKDLDLESCSVLATYSALILAMSEICKVHLGSVAKIPLPLIVMA